MNQALLNEYMRGLIIRDHWYNRALQYNNIPWALQELRYVDHMFDRIKGDNNGL